jgi:hypothetical protein
MPRIINADDTDETIDKVRCPSCNRPMALQGQPNGKRNRHNDAYLVFKDAAEHRLAVPADALKYGAALQAVAQTGDVNGCLNFMIPRRPKVRETFSFEIWEKNRKRRGRLKHVRNRTRQEATEAVQGWLQLTGYDKWVRWTIAIPPKEKEIEGFDDIIVSRIPGRNEGEKVIVAVVKYRKVGQNSSYHEVLRIELHEKRLADEIVAGLSDFLVARLL